MRDATSTIVLHGSGSNVAQFGDIVSRTIFARMLRDAGRYEVSANELKASVKVFGVDPRVWYNLIKSLTLAGKYDEALDYCHQAIEKMPDHPPPLISMGELLRGQAKYQESLLAYSTALKTFTYSRPAQIGKASVLILLGRESEAEKLLSNLELESEIDWYAYHTLCVSILKAKRVDEAIVKLEFAIKTVPWKTLRNYFADTLGYAMLRKGFAAEALASFRTGLRTADYKKKIGILLLMSSASTELGQKRKALQYWNMAAPKTPDTVCIKSLLKLHKGRGIAGPRATPNNELETAALDMLLGMAT